MSSLLKRISETNEANRKLKLENAALRAQLARVGKPGQGNADESAGAGPSVVLGIGDGDAGGNGLTSTRNSSPDSTVDSAPTDRTPEGSGLNWATRWMQP